MELNDDTEYATIRIVSGGHFANTVVTADDKPVDNVTGIEWSIVNGIASARVTFELVEVDVIVQNSITIPTAGDDVDPVELVSTRH
jgi:hypothetical protein